MHSLLFSFVEKHVMDHHMYELLLINILLHDLTCFFCENPSNALFNVLRDRTRLYQCMYW